VRLREKYPDLEADYRAATGRGFDALTESEARFFLKFKPADALRARFAAERDGARRRLGEGSAGEDVGPFARARAISCATPRGPGGTRCRLKIAPCIGRITGG
jgi:hypothetical protein